MTLCHARVSIDDETSCYLRDSQTALATGPNASSAVTIVSTFVVDPGTNSRSLLCDMSYCPVATSSASMPHCA